MTSRTFKLLTASTAFVAAASAGHAATISTSSTSPVSTTTNGTLFVSGSAIISTTGTPAILVSGTGVGDVGNATVGISSSAIIRSDSVTGTIAIPANTGISGTLTINNSGSIINYGTGAAISTTATVDGGQPAVVINNTGLISGSVVNGTGALSYTGTGATQNGGITSGASTGNIHVVTLQNSTSMVGNISLGGSSTITVSGSTLTGTITGGAGVDTLTIKGGSLVTGAVDLGAQNNVVTINGSTLAVTSGAALTTGSDNDTVTLVNATVSGGIVLGGGTDNLYISGTNAFTTKGTITGAEVIGVSGTTANFNHAITGGTTPAVTTAANGRINFNVDQTFTGGTLTNNGTMDLTNSTVTAANYTAGSGSNLRVTVSDSTHAGKLVLNTGGANLSTTSLTVTFGVNSGFIASGTTYTLVDGGNTSQLQGSLLASNTGVYRISTSLVTGGAANSDIVLTVGRISTSNVVNGGSGKAVAHVLDVLGAGATGALNTVQGLIGSQLTAQGVDNVVQTLLPGVDGAGATNVEVTNATGNQVSKRLASLRSSGVATGDPMATSHLWVEGFGSSIDQDNRNGQYGYDATSGGVTFGVDSDMVLEGVTTGASFSYAQSSVDSKSVSNASTDINSYIGTLYGSKVMDDGLFINGQLGFGYNDYETERTVSGVGQAKGDTNGWQATAKVEAGKDFAMDAITLTPLASLQYTYVDIDGYTETGAGGANLTVNPDAMSTVDAAVGGQIAYAYPLRNGGSLVPSAHAKYVYRMGDTALDTTSRFTGGGAAFSTGGVKADRSSVNLGAGLLLTTVGGTDLSLNYDADIRSNLIGHSGQVKARWAF